MPSQRGNTPPVDPFPPLRREASSSSTPPVPSYASIAARSSHPHRGQQGAEGEHDWTAEDIDRRDTLDELNPNPNPYAEPIDVDPSPPWRSRHRSSTSLRRAAEEEDRPAAASAEAGPSRGTVIGTPSGSAAARVNAVANGARNPSQRREGDGVSTPTTAGPNRPADRSPPSPSPTRPTGGASQNTSPGLTALLTLEEMLSNIRPQSQQDSRASSSTTRPTGETVRAVLEDRRRQREAAVSGSVPWGMERALPSDADRTAAAMDLAAMDFELMGEPVIVPFPRATDGDGTSRTFAQRSTGPLDGSAANQAITSFLRRRRRNPARAPNNMVMTFDPDELHTSGQDFEDEATVHYSDDGSDDEPWASTFHPRGTGNQDRDFDVDGPGPARSAGTLHRGGNNRRRRSFLQRIGAPPDLRFPEPDEGIHFPPPVRGIADATGCEPTNRALAASVVPLVVRSGGVRRPRDIEEDAKDGVKSDSPQNRKRRRTSSISRERAPSRPSYLSYSTLPIDASLPSAFVPPIRRSHLALSTYTSTSHPPRPLITFVGFNPTGQDPDATALITTVSAPVAAGVYYYEVEVIDKGIEGFMSVGWMKEGTSLRRLVGWDKGSWGWHGDDGRSFEGQARGEEFSATWTKGDTVGCGVDFTTGRAFFTKNGKMMGHRFKNLGAGLHPAVGLRSVGESLAINLTGPFKFGIDDYVKSTRDGVRRTASKDQKVDQVPRLVDQVPTAAPTETSGKGKVTVRADEDQVMSEDSTSRSVPGRSPLESAMDRTASAFVLDYLRHNGHQSSLSLLQSRMGTRGWIRPSPSAASVSAPDESKIASGQLRLSDFSSKSAALKGLHNIIAESFDRPAPWGLVDDLTCSKHELENDELEKVKHNLMIFDFLHLLHHSAQNPTPTSTSSSSDDSFEKLLDKGRNLRQLAKSQVWSAADRAVLEEAFGLLVSPDLVNNQVWKSRRVVWADQVVFVLREINGLKELSHLEQAIKQTRVVLRTLAEKDGRTGAAFLDPAMIME